VQTEIEEFLQQAMGRRGPPKRKETADGIEIIEPQVAKQPPPSRPPQTAIEDPGAVNGPQSVFATTSDRPGDNIASRQGVGSLEAGNAVRAHVQEHMNSRVAAHVQSDLPHAITASIAQHLGEFRGGVKDARKGAAPLSVSSATDSDPTGLLAQIRQPSGMRKAVILQEVLNKPRALRKH
jgi:hypothetical protein